MSICKWVKELADFENCFGYHCTITNLSDECISLIIKPKVGKKIYKYFRPTRLHDIECCKDTAFVFADTFHE